MATILVDGDRDIVPRWRTFSNTVLFGELRSSRQIVKLPQSLSSEQHWSEKLGDWREEKTLAHAAELVNAAYVTQRFVDAEDAANFLLESPNQVSQSLQDIARIVLGQSDDMGITIEDSCDLERESIGGRIAKLKDGIRREPRNAIHYVDLALFYTLLDQHHPAERAMNTAIAIAPNNRFVLRSASRLFLHLHDEARAHNILRYAERTKYDPWLMAAEIGVAAAANHSARYLKTGQVTVESNSVLPNEITELAAAIAMEEIEHGKNRVARKFIEKAMIDPTENSLAQIGWAERHRGIRALEPFTSFENVPRIHEARAWEYFAKGDWQAAFREGVKWFYDQPFSGRPVSLASYIASGVLNDYDQAIAILEKGQISNPHNFTIINNLAFSHASKGETEKAEALFETIDLANLSAIDSIIATATNGLIAYRKGLFAEGRHLYLNALQLASNHNLNRLEARAAIYFAREELRVNSIQGADLKEFAFRRVKSLGDLELRTIAEIQLGSEITSSDGQS